MRPGPKALIGLGRPAALRPHTPGKGGGASAYAPYPAPIGFRWDFVTFSGDRVTSGGEPVVALIGA